MNKYLPNDKEHIHVYGRTTDTAPMPLFWTASGVEFVTKSSEVWMELEAEYNSAEEWIEIYIDDCLYQRFVVPCGKNEYCVFKGFNEHELKKVVIRKSCQPIQDDGKRKLLIHSISCDEVIEETSDKKYRFEFIGDSLTSGEGLTGSQNINSWCPAIFGTNGHYGIKTAAYFEADYSIVSQSGWGVYCGWDNNIKNNIPAYYHQICGVLAGEDNRSLGAFEENDFSKYIPDVIVINLGTNDGGALNQAAWTDPDTGISYKQSKLEDGTLTNESHCNFSNAAVEFLKKVRKYNSKAYIVWAYGMCDYTMKDEIRSVIDRYILETNDKNIGVVWLPNAKDEWLGSHGHPGVRDHEASAQTLIDFLENNKSNWQ